GVLLVVLLAGFELQRGGELLAQLDPRVLLLGDRVHHPVGELVVQPQADGEEDRRAAEGAQGGGAGLVVVRPRLGAGADRRALVAGDALGEAVQRRDRHQDVRRRFPLPRVLRLAATGQPHGRSQRGDDQTRQDGAAREHGAPPGGILCNTLRAFYWFAGKVT